MPIQHFPPPPGIKAPPLSFATRVGDLLFISGIPGFDVNGDLPDGFEAQFGFVVTNIKRDVPRSGQGQRAADAGVRRGDDECAVRVGVRARALSRPHHLRRAGAAAAEDADRDRGRGGAEGVNCGL